MSEKYMQTTDPQRRNGPAQNTDRELWREAPGDYYANSIHVTEAGGIGINVGGTVYVKPLKEWHALAERAADPAPARSSDKHWHAVLVGEHDLHNAVIHWSTGDHDNAMMSEAPDPAPSREPEIVARPDHHPLDKLYADPQFQVEYHEELARERAAEPAPAEGAPQFGAYWVRSKHFYPEIWRVAEALDAAPKGATE